MDYLKCPFLLLIIIKMTKKEILKKLEEAQNYCDKYDYDECLSTLFEISNEDDKYYEVLQDFIDQDTAEEFLKHELENWGLVRLYYAMWNVRPYWNEYVRINAYWNLEEITKDDLQFTINEIKDRIED